MGKQSDEIREVARLRKAVLPLVKLLSSEAVSEVSKRLDTIEESLTEIAKRDMNVTVTAPEVHVGPTVFDVDKLITALDKSNKALMAKSASPALPDYQPHDQAGSSAIKYNGFVAQDGSWYIQRVAKGGQRYAKGKGNYSEAWEKRGDQTYRMYDGSK